MKTYRIQAGFIVEMELWGEPENYKNWLAVVTLAPNKPGGLDRRFVRAWVDGNKRRIPAYSAADVRRYDCIEWGSDARSEASDRERRRVYQVVMDHTETLLRCRTFPNAVTAFMAADALRNGQTVDFPDDETCGSEDASVIRRFQF